MIRLTRLNGSEFSLNPDLIHRAEETPDTVLTLIDGSRYVVVESLDDIIARIVGYRARVVAVAGALTASGDDRPYADDRRPHADDDHADDDHADRADVVRLRSRRA